MAYVAVNKNGTETMFPNHPIRNESVLSLNIEPYEWELYEDVYCISCDYVECINLSIELPKGSIKKLIGKDITWQDNPVKLE